MNKSQINIEDLFDWLEQQPELAHLRKQAAATPCEYCPTEITTNLRLKSVSFGILFGCPVEICGATHSQLLSLTDRLVQWRS